MPKCGSQVVLCDLPVRFDTYKGCSHGCVYCFAQKKANMSDIKPYESVFVLKNFIEGKRGRDTSWCDWDIPLHWGGMSDPFQPAEKVFRRSYDCLKVFAETGYPFVFSTKGALAADPEYLGLFAKCNVVGQVSMVSPKYDGLEVGAPTFLERLGMLEKIAPNVKRLIVRISPYSAGLANEVASYMQDFKNAGVYGIEIEAMKRGKKRDGWVKVGGDYCYPVEVLRRDFETIRDAAKQSGLAFFVGENRLRAMGDSTTCCGVAGVPGFNPNTANLNSFIKNGRINYRQKMEEIGTAKCFLDGYLQDSVSNITIKKTSYKEMMEIATKTKVFLNVMGADVTGGEPDILSN